MMPALTVVGVRCLTGYIIDRYRCTPVHITVGLRFELLALFLTEFTSIKHISQVDYEHEQQRKGVDSRGEIESYQNMIRQNKETPFIGEPNKGVSLKFVWGEKQKSRSNLGQNNSFTYISILLSRIACVRHIRETT